MITLVRQPTGSRQYGHACLSMITKISIEDIVKVVGHDHSTKVKELISILRVLGHEPSDKLIRVSKKRGLPDVAILITRYSGIKRGNWHWVVLYNKHIYDPLQWYPIPYEHYIKEWDAQVTSYIKINKL